MRRFNAQGLHFLDLIALTIANRWRWEREPFRLTVPGGEAPACLHELDGSAITPPSLVRFRHAE